MMSSLTHFDERTLGWVRYSSICASLTAFDRYFEEYRPDEYAHDLWKKVCHASSLNPNSPMDLKSKVRFEVSGVLDSFRTQLSDIERFFLLFETPNLCCVASCITSVVVMAGICLSSFTFILSSDPGFQNMS